MRRTDHLERLKTEHFDLLIIGGGASGAGCALDAAGRGLRVALVESGDFAAGTSSKSTKLIHGGVRYLEQAVKNADFGQLKQVRHGLHERRAMLESAPFLARPLELVTPCTTWVEAAYFFVGLKIYDWLAGRKNNLPSAKFLSKKQVLEKMPGLKNSVLYAAVAYFDGQFDDARYALLLALTAAERGATMANYLIVNGFEKDADGKITAARVEDRLTGDQFLINAKQVLNCTGPASDTVRQMANPALETRLRPSKGAHILLPQSVLGNEKAALLIPKTKDGRMVFAIPTGSELLVGTTDTPASEPEKMGNEPLLGKKEAAFLLETLNRYLETPARFDQIKAGFAGLRPLIAAEKTRSTATLLRDHEVEFDEQSGLVSLLGGKWTTWRLMASDAVDFVCKQLNINELCSTQGLKLVGTDGFSFDKLAGFQQRTGLPEDVVLHLFQNYGNHADDVFELASTNPSFSKKLTKNRPFIHAEVIYQVRSEMAVTVRDVLARRWRLEQHNWAATRELMPLVADILAGELGWTEAEKARKLEDYGQVLRKMKNATIN